VRTLEKGGEHSLLAEALITQGTALSRVGKQTAARASFLRAAEITDISGDPYSSGRAYLALIEELQRYLPARETLQHYLAADQRLGNNFDDDTIARLRRCARITIEKAMQRESSPSTEATIGEGLEEQVLHFESQLIRDALDEANGSITRAARNLGLTHQGLAYIISTRHEKLMTLRRPPRTRRRSIIRKS
jgi:hypothetical protein